MLTTTSTTPLMFQPLVKYFDFNGRARRSEYWLFTLFLVLSNIAIGIVEEIVEGPGASRSSFVDVISILFFFGTLIPSLSVSVRRFHDINRTGWWVIFPLVVLIIGLTIFVMQHGSTFIRSVEALDIIDENTPPADVLDLVAKAFGPLSLWVLLPTWLASLWTLFLNLIDGTVGLNRFGTDPKNR